MLLFYLAEKLSPIELVSSLRKEARGSSRTCLCRAWISLVPLHRTIEFST